MDKDKNLLENEQLFKSLFENFDEKEEKLYKNDLFTPSTEKEEYSNDNQKKSQTEIMRDKILKKLSLEDYMLFPPKNDSILINDNELGKDKEDQEKLFEEEIDHLRNLHKLNYLTFSPFGISFFPNLNYMTQKNEEKNQNLYNMTDESVEKENKILNIIDFDYNNYEINNDLLFNISMGFIDINRLKHENVVSSENFIPRSQRISLDNKIRNLQNSAPKPKVENIKKPENIYKKDIEFKDDLMNKLVHFVKEHENVEFYTSTIDSFYKELNTITSIKENKENKEKNKLLIKWQKIFIERQKLYKKYLMDKQDKERKKRKEERIKKDIEKRIEQQKIYQIQKEKQFEEELEKIRKKGIKNFNKNRKSFNVGIGVLNRNNSMEKLESKRSEDLSNNKSLYTIRSNSTCSLNNKIGKKSSNKNLNSSKIERKKSLNYNNERYGYQKSNDDYFFKLI